MKCPKCGHDKSGVSRTTKLSYCTARKHTCQKCGHKFTTVEKPDISGWDIINESVREYRNKKKAEQINAEGKDS